MRARTRIELPRLFPREALCLRATGQARLREMARRPCERVGSGERRRIEDRETMERLRRQGAELAGEFGLRWTALDAERDGVTGHYGICYEDGEIRIRLRHAKTGRLLKESSLVDTLCHELAHLRHLNHGKGFQRLYRRILYRARALGFYKPGPADTRPRQARMFEGEGCGTANAVVSQQ